VNPECQEPRLCIAVEDTGVGIPPADAERIFETFVQLRPGPSGAYAGVGLGLPVAKSIAERLGGGIQLRSEEDRGSTFTIRAATGPLHDAQWTKAETVSIAPAELPQPVISSHGHGTLRGTVLLAEDFTDTRRLIEEVLTGCGVAVTTVENGEDAVRAALASPFDLILMDIRMPRMDGLTAAAELRRQGCLTAIIALTASTDPDSRERVLAAGFDDMWTKPIGLGKLVTEIAAYLRTPVDEAPGGEAPGAAQASDGSDAWTTTNPRLLAARAEFVRNLPARLSRIQSAVRNRDMREAREVLHQLVGSGGIFGYMSLSEETARLLSLARTGVLAERVGELQRLEELITQITAALGE